jgi:hypothetical protein
MTLKGLDLPKKSLTKVSTAPILVCTKFVSGVNRCKHVDILSVIYLSFVLPERSVALKLSLDQNFLFESTKPDFGLVQV